MIMNQRGQFTVEAVLILSILFMVVSVIGMGFRQNDLFSQMVSAPWSRLAGMLQNGAWAPPAVSMQLHPTNHSRHVSTRGEEPR